MSEDKTPKVFKCPHCGSEIISKFSTVTIVTNGKAVLNPETHKAEMQKIDDQEPIEATPCEYACAECSTIFSWQQIKEAIEPKVNQILLFPVSSPEPQTEDAKQTTTSNEEKPCATNVESAVNPAESSLNDTEKKTSTNANTVDTTTTDTNAPAPEDKEKNEP